MDVNYFPSTREYAQYGVDKTLLDSLNKEIVIMHPGPINRGRNYVGSGRFTSICNFESS
jgi:aspartate carbamoyltransferase catalytic subunit